MSGGGHSVSLSFLLQTGLSNPCSRWPKAEALTFKTYGGSILALPFSTISGLQEIRYFMMKESYTGAMEAVQTQNLGMTTSYMAECSGILSAAISAEEKGWHNLNIISDSKAAVSAFNNNCMPWQMHSQWGYVKDRLNISLQHSWREANFNADTSANKACYLPDNIGAWEPHYNSSSVYEHLFTLGSVSLEAKKKFKVPRIISKRFELMEECSPSTKEHVSANERKEEHASEELTTINCSQGSLLELENLNDGSTPNDSMDDGIVTDESLDSPSGNLIQSEDARLLEQSTSKAVHSRSLTLNKEHQYKFVSEGVEGKTRLANRKVIVRSSYFQHKLVNEKNLENENEKLESDEDGTEGVICETTRKSALYPNSFLKSALKKRKFTPVERAKTEIVKVKHALANHPRNSMLILDVYLEVEANEEPPTQSVLSVSAVTVTSRSRGSLRDVLVLDMDLEVKAAPTVFNTFQLGDCFQSDNSPSDAEENKFGCNISHINNYSDIAEKSMERFVSVVSSFRCTSSGSRASGLRAPLKDVRNTLVGIRSPIPPKDLSKFSYGTNNRKTASVSLED
ncbi:hypothetical protein GIB67_034826 [Kingdonia uniflora]|uniref:RNase H type-1 domain-containing protein n=1 Tax=Kingdonia uniflora TaxID=39325 RepID=A0A7J7MEC1_9MAGN|nr:hypothetical protein GIB67_034826 [Kingdonia uniflora]